jgi:aminopeptidase N
MSRNPAKILFWIFLLGSISAFADPYARQPSVDAIHYDLSIEVTDTSDSIAGIAKLQVLIRDKSATGMWLDFEDMSVEKLLVGGTERPFAHSNGRLDFEFDRSYSRNETVAIEVRYHGKPREGLLFGRNRYGRRVIFADNWPDNARHWFPSIDHPSDKAAVSFTVTAPKKYTVVANGKMGRTVPLPKARRVARWSEGKAIPTYSMAFGIGEFSVLNSAEGAIPLTWYVYPQDSEVAAAKFRRTAQMLAFFEDRIGPYPYDKLAQVESIVKFGAMENSNAIFYSDSLFLAKPVSDEPVAHEIAHQWFGNSVTESDWDHLWLSEGFATYFEALFFEHAGGPEALKQIMARHADRIAAYKPALYEPVVNPGQTDPLKKLTPLIYEKGAWILHMLRGMLGDEVFFNGIRRFYSMYEGRNASSEDFQRVMEAVSATDLSSYFREWLHRPGLPEYRLTWHWSESAGELDISVLQVQATGLFDMPMEIVVSAENRKEVHRVRIGQAAHTFRIPLRTKPSAVELDPNNWILKGGSPAAQ